MANKNNFNEGAFHLSRSIFESDLWFKPPEYLKIFLYLVGKANHKAKKYKGCKLKRGQYFCSYAELREQVSYRVGFRKKRCHESFMKHLMNYLRSTLRITTTKEPRGMIITICNYDDYQSLKNYERTDERTDERTSREPAANQDPPSINKNVKNEKKESKDPKDARAIPRALSRLKLYAADKKLCARWDELLEAWQLAFPEIDIITETVKAHAWELAQPANKQKKNRAAFLNNWLKSEQAKLDKRAKQLKECSRHPDGKCALGDKCQKGNCVGGYPDIEQGTLSDDDQAHRDKIVAQIKKCDLCVDNYWQKSAGPLCEQPCREALRFSMDNCNKCRARYRANLIDKPYCEQPCRMTGWLEGKNELF